METLKNLETTHKIGLGLLALVIVYFIFSGSSSTTTTEQQKSAETKKEKFQVASVGAEFNKMLVSDKDGNFTSIEFPKNMIILYHGSSIPAGWAVCDGTKGTPDLRGRFVVGVNPESKRNPSLRSYAWKSTGGKETSTFTITLPFMPDHDHEVIQDQAYDSGSSWDSDRGRNVATPGGNKKVTPAFVGGPKPYTIPVDEKQLPHYALIYLMKL
jgi:hypothetical protein